MIHDPRILVACIGNIFLGDDAFGVEVARKLLDRPMPPGTRVVDFGIRGLDLTYALLEEWDVAILVDAAQQGLAPGTVFIVEPPPFDTPPGAVEMMPGEILIETHGMDPMKVLRLVHAMGGSLRRILVVGCEPTPVDFPDEMEMTMTPLVAKAVDEAVTVVESLVARIHAGQPYPYSDLSTLIPVVKGDSSHAELPSPI